jgi:hypothetical protein
MQNDKNTVEKLKEKKYGFLWLNFKYAKGKTNENEIIKGGSFYAFGKQLFTIAYADTDWVDEDGKPYKFKLDRGMLYVKKIALGFL